MTKFISSPNIGTMKPVHEDERRSIREAEMELPDGSIKRVTELTVHGIARATLGNHYHRVPEYFTVHDGKPTILTAPKDAPNEVTVHDLPDGGFIIMGPEQVHTFIFDGPGRLVSTMDGAFDPTDMAPQKLEEPNTDQ
jgi:quercetin dioxygenase-like cupin family protein